MKKISLFSIIVSTTFMFCAGFCSASGTTPVQTDPNRMYVRPVQTDPNRMYVRPVQTDPNRIHVRVDRIEDDIQTHEFLDSNIVDPNSGSIWANSALINTQKTVTVTAPANVRGLYELIVYNPSTVTDLTVKIFNVQASNFAGASRNSYLTSVSIPKSQTITGTAINCYSRLIQGVFNGVNLYLVLSNDTALGGSDGFTAYSRVRAVK